MANPTPSNNDDSTKFPSPPQAPPTWKDTPEGVITLTNKLIAKDKAFWNKIGALSEEECTFDSVFLEIALAEAELKTLTEPLVFYQNVAASKELREASSKAEDLLKHHQIGMTMRLDVHQAKINAEKNIKGSGHRKLNPEEKRLVKKVILDGKRAGLDLPEEERRKLKELKKKLSETCTAFMKNFNEENGSVEFTLDELKGVPPGDISHYTKREEDGVTYYKVTFKSPDANPLSNYAENPDTRQKMYRERANRLGINVPLVGKALGLRHQIAKLLGFNSWGDYVLEVRMAKNVDGVRKFLDDLHDRLKPVGSEEFKKLLELKEKEHKEKGYYFDRQFYISDFCYYNQKLSEGLGLDGNLVKEYFPVSFTVQQIFKVYENLFSIKFVKIQGGDTWHPEVEQYSVWRNDAKKPEDFIGYCYLDLFPRDFKYSDFAVWGLIPGYTKLDETRQYPTTAMVVNLARESFEHPALMTHEDTLYFFHEFGHLVHDLLSRTQFSRFHGLSVASDFVEAPSQMLENWVWEPKVLRIISRHYKNQQPLPDDLIEKLIESRHSNVALKSLDQLFYANFDLEVHTKGLDWTDYTTLWNELRQKIFLAAGPGPPLLGLGAFSHIMEDYDCGYYGYLYSQVFAMDMYSTAFKEDPLDSTMGEKYKNSILAPGGSRNELDMLEEFLGHKPNGEAFVKALFSNSEAELS